MTTEKFRKILIDLNWFRDYYYIKKVIESCREANPLTAITARKWGLQTLERTLDYVMEKYKLSGNFVYGYAMPYLDDVRETARKYEMEGWERKKNGITHKKK